MYVEDENVNSGACFTELRKECFQIINQKIIADTSTSFPNIVILAKEERLEMKKQPLEVVAKDFYQKDQKINCIKYIRDRFGADVLGLLEAKMMADGYWARFDYLKVPQTSPF